MDLRRKLRDGRHRLWWRLATRGHEDAFARLYGELYGPVAGFVGQQINNRQDAEDLVSLVFQRFLERLDSYVPDRGSVMSWILAMARNAVIDHHRYQAAHGAARSQEMDVDDLSEVAGCQETPLTAMIRDEETALLQQWLARQAADTQEMFALRYGHGLRLKEVAQVMALSEAAVKQRFARTTRQIRHELSIGIGANPKDKEGPECMTAD